MAKKGFLNEKMDAVRRWWDSDTTKAISTIVAVLLIPGAVLAWNYASGRNANNVDDTILEGESTNVAEENSNMENEEATTDENVMTDDTVMEENNEENMAANETEENTDLEIGGMNEVTTLPNTSSAE